MSRIIVVHSSVPNTSPGSRLSFKVFEWVLDSIYTGSSLMNDQTNEQLTKIKFHFNKDGGKIFLF